jgi:hypothetical protein
MGQVLDGPEIRDAKGSFGGEAVRSRLVAQEKPSCPGRSSIRRTVPRMRGSPASF